MSNRFSVDTPRRDRVRDNFKLGAHTATQASVIMICDRLVQPLLPSAEKRANRQVSLQRQSRGTIRRLEALQQMTVEAGATLGEILETDSSTRNEMNILE